MIGFPKHHRLEDKYLRNYMRRFPCWACGEAPGNEMNPIDPSHILTRGAGHPDAWWNVCAHCRKCHDAFERGRMAFLEEHPRFLARLRAMGWEIETVFGKKKLWHPYLEENES